MNSYKPLQSKIITSIMIIFIAFVFCLSTVRADYINFTLTSPANNSRWYGTQVNFSSYIAGSNTYQTNNTINIYNSSGQLNQSITQNVTEWADFNGNSNGAINSSINLNNESFMLNHTYAIWFKLSSYLLQNESSLFSYVQGNERLSLDLKPSYPYIQFKTRNSSNTCPSGATINNPFNLNQWYFVVGVYNGSNLLYFNGIFNISGIGCYNFNPLGSTFWLGSTNVGSGNSERFNGSLDEVREWNRSLSSNEILSLYNLGRTQQQLNSSLSLGQVLYLPLDSSLKDFSRNSNNGTNNGATFNSSASPQSWTFDNFVNGYYSYSIDGCGVNTSLGSYCNSSNLWNFFIGNLSILSYNVSNGTLTNNGSSSWQEKANLTYNIISDGAIDQNEYSWYVDGVLKLQGFGLSKFSYLFLNQQANQNSVIRVDINDSAGSISQTFSEFFNSWNPFVSITFPGDTQAHSKNGTIDINYTASDYSPQNCWYAINYGAATSKVLFGINWSSIGLTSTDNIISVYCNDSVNNIGSDTHTFHISTTNLISPFDLKTILINDVAGSVEIFSFLAVILISFLFAKFSLPGKIVLILYVLFTVIMAAYMGGLYVLFIIVSGLVTYWGVSKIVS
jgi:hypothetical protein